MYINVNKFETEIPKKYNRYRGISGWVNIERCNQLTRVTGFTRLTSIGLWLSIKNNDSLVEVSGFENLNVINNGLHVFGNPYLINLSIPRNVLNGVRMDKNYKIIANHFHYDSAEEYINSPEIINDLVDKFNPDIHGDLVVKQIIENVDEWGTRETKDEVYSLLASMGLKKSIPQKYLNQYHPDTIKNNNKIITDYLQMSN